MHDPLPSELSRRAKLGVVKADAGRRVLDDLLAAARDKGLLKTAGRPRTDATHVLSSARELSWLEMVAETLRSALNALAKTAPEWLVGVAEPGWFRHYAARAEDSRFPKTRTKREEAACGSVVTGCVCSKRSSPLTRRLARTP